MLFMLFFSPAGIDPKPDHNKVATPSLTDLHPWPRSHVMYTLKDFSLPK